MEGQVYVRCRKIDVPIFEEIKEEAIQTYREKIVKEVLRFKGKEPTDIHCQVIMYTRYLENIDENETTGCIGGFKVFAQKGRIVVS